MNELHGTRNEIESRYRIERMSFLVCACICLHNIPIHVRKKKSICFTFSVTFYCYYPIFAQKRNVQHLSHLLLSRVEPAQYVPNTRTNVYIFIIDMFIPDYVTSIYLLCYQLEMNKLPSSCESSTLRLCYTCNNFCAWPNSKRLKCL